MAQPSNGTYTTSAVDAAADRSEESRSMRERLLASLYPHTSSSSRGSTIRGPSGLVSRIQRSLPAYLVHAPEPYAEIAANGQFSTGLLDWFAQPGGLNMCCLSLWLPCVQYGMIVEQLPQGAVTCGGNSTGACTLFLGLGLVGGMLGALLDLRWALLPMTALLHCMTRSHIRHKYGIQPEQHPLHDFMVTYCCAPCALCQEARELVIRGAQERTGEQQPRWSTSGGADMASPPVYYVMAGPRSAYDGPNGALPPGLHMAPGGQVMQAVIGTVATGVPVQPPSQPPPTHVATVTLASHPSAPDAGRVPGIASSLQAASSSPLVLGGGLATSGADGANAGLAPVLSAAPVVGSGSGTGGGAPLPIAVAHVHDASRSQGSPARVHNEGSLVVAGSGSPAATRGNSSGSSLPTSGSKPKPKKDDKDS